MSYPHGGVQDMSSYKLGAFGAAHWPRSEWELKIKYDDSVTWIFARVLKSAF
jgi:hypothetical protein